MLNLSCLHRLLEMGHTMLVNLSPHAIRIFSGLAGLFKVKSSDIPLSFLAYVKASFMAK